MTLINIRRIRGFALTSAEHTLEFPRLAEPYVTEHKIAYGSATAAHSVVRYFAKDAGTVSAIHEVIRFAQALADARGFVFALDYGVLA